MVFLKIYQVSQENTFVERLQPRCFSVKLAKYLREPILKNIYQRLLLIDGLKPGLLRMYSRG